MGRGLTPAGISGSSRILTVGDIDDFIDLGSIHQSRVTASLDRCAVRREGSRGHNGHSAADSYESSEEGGEKLHGSEELDWM